MLCGQVWIAAVQIYQCLAYPDMAAGRALREFGWQYALAIAIVFAGLGLVARGEASEMQEESR